MIHKLVAFTTVILTLLSFELKAQTVYPVTWHLKKNVELLNGDLVRTASAKGRGTAVSAQILFGKGESNTFEGSFEYVANNNTELKKIGWVVVNNPELSNTQIAYGFAFKKNGKIRAFSTDGDISQNYSSGTTAKLQRNGNLIEYLIDGAIIYTVKADEREDLELRASLVSPGASFGGVSLSYNTTPFCVQPTINHLNKTIVLSVTGAFPPYRYTWDNGDRTKSSLSQYLIDQPVEQRFKNGNYYVTITDAQKNSVRRMYSIGSLVQWTNFLQTEAPNNVLQKTVPQKWGTATSDQVFVPSSKLWVEYIIEKETQGSKAIGLVESGVTISKLKQLKAGFLISKEELKIIIDGSIVSTLEYQDKDALNLKYTDGGIEWLQNGMVIYRSKLVLTSNITIAGFVRGQSTLKEVSFDANTIDLITTTFDNNTETGSINLNIGTLGMPGPYHYLISEEPIPHLDDTYLALRDSLYGDTLGLDSLKFYLGNVNETSYSFADLWAGTYYVSVFDSQGNRIFADKRHIQGTLSFDNQTDLLVQGSVLSATEADAHGSIEIYTYEDEGGIFEFEITKTRGVEQFFGLAESATDVSSYQDLTYGYYLDNRKLYTVENGVLSQEFEVIRRTRKLTLSLIDGQLEFSTDLKSLSTVTLPSTYEYKIGVGLQPNASIKMLYKAPFFPIYFFRPYRIKKFVNQHLKCDDNQSAFTFSVAPSWWFSGGGILPINYSIVNQTNGQIVVSGISGSTATSIYTNSYSGGAPLDAGVYVISGFIYGFTTIAFSTTIYLGYEAQWTDDFNYTFTPNSYSVERTLPTATSITAASKARSENLLAIAQYGWMEFTPVATNNAFLGNDLIRLSSQNIASVLPSFGDEFLLFRKLGVNQRMFMAFGQAPYFSVVPTNARIRIIFDTDIKVYSNGALKGTFPRSTFTNLARVLSIKQSDGFDNVITSFSCTPVQTLDQMSHAELKKTVNAGHTLAVENTLLFTFDGEYEVSTSTFLAYNVYDKNRLLKASCDNAGVTTGGGIQLAYNLEDNRYGLDLSGITGMVPNDYYLLEVIDSKGGKKYLKFLFKY